MRINKLDHYNIIANAKDIERVKQFYGTIFGFEEGPRPDFPIDGVWLYSEKLPLLHLVVIDRPDSPKPKLRETTTGFVHHIAFDCEGLDDFKALLEDNGIEFWHESIDEWGIEQLFFHDPVGMRIELNFKNG